MKTSLLAFLVFCSTFSFAQGTLPWQLVLNVVPWPNAQYVFASDSSYVYAYSTENSSGRLFRSASKGAPGTWTELTNDPADMSGYGCQLYKSGKYLYLLESICFSARLFRSDDDGLTWTQPDTSFGRSYFVCTLAFLTDGSILAVKITSDPAFYRSTDNGNSWTKAFTLPINYMSGYYNFIEKNGNTYFICDSTVLVSADGGASWTDLHATVPAYGQTVLLSDGTFLMYAGGKIYTSVNAINWTLKPFAGIPAIAIYPEQLVRSLTSDSLFLVATDYSTTHNLLYSADLGASWGSFDAGISLPSQVNNSFWVYRLHLSSNGYMYVSPQGGGIYRTSNNYTAVTTVWNSKNETRVYPSPAAGTLNVFLPQELSGDYSITIADITGRTVKTEVRKAGNREHIAQLDIASLPPGIYTASIGTDYGIEVRKFVKE